MFANVKTLGIEFSWSFGGKFTVAQSVVWQALVANGFDAKLSRVACPRHAFLRALRAWLSAETGGRVDHTISDVLDSRVTETADTLRIQIDDKFVDQTAMGVTFTTRGVVSVDKKSGTVSGSPQLATEIEKQIPFFQENRNSIDLNNLVHRLAEKVIGSLGLIPWHSRGAYLVLDSHRNELARIVSFIAAVGGQVATVELYHVTPAQAPAAAPQSQPTAQVSQPTGNQTAVATAISDRIEELTGEYEKQLWEINKKEWKSEKCREKAIERIWELAQEANSLIYTEREMLKNHAIRLEDNLAYVAKLMGKTLQVSAPFTLETDEEHDYTSPIVGDNRDYSDYLASVKV